MAIHLITDFGLEGPYTGQVLARLHLAAPLMPVFNLFADAPAFDVRRSAYLVAAYGVSTAPGDVLLCVVDPGVGTERAGLVLQADGRYFVGPDNGLLAVAARRAEHWRWWQLAAPPAKGPQSFHGRDWFAPVAARLACGDDLLEKLSPPQNIVGLDWPPDLPEVVYIDRYGNALTGLRASALSAAARLRVGGREIERGHVFAAATPGVAFWYANANGVVEIALDRERADAVLGLRVGSPVAVV